jgi:uncharacterized SAM-binding protein YcdF (DUF218 family)
VFFALSKTLDLLLAPLTWALLLVVAAAWGVYRGKRRLALVSLCVATGVLLVFSSSWTSDALAGWLEAGATTTFREDETYDAVVVLGGFTSSTSTPQAPEYNEAVERLLAGYDLLRRNRARYVLVTSDAQETQALANQLVDWGIDPARVVIEDHSRNTHENAVRSAAIIRERFWTRILLVTSALHMPRAAGCFRAAGLTFDTLAVDHLTPSRQPDESPGPRVEALTESTRVLREGFGRLVYRAMGYSR